MERPASTWTTTTLLSSLREPGNQIVWSEFDARYRPIILGIARRIGLCEADAADVAQETLTRFTTQFRADKYDRSKGRLRSWMLGIARNCIVDLHRRVVTRRERRGDSALVQVCDDELDEHWDAERQRVIFEAGMAELRRETRLDEQTIQAFELVAVAHRPPAEVAAELGISVDSVYAAKNRCIAKLREICERLEAMYDDGAATAGHDGR
jgi:RNA polymerase sigma-70 factor (ECF subfamily)